MQLSGSQKDKNIVEYLIYMWHIEDVIRTYDFNIELIDEYIISRSGLPTLNKIEAKDWYQELIRQMKQQGLDQKGHLKELRTIIDDLTTLHSSLVNVIQDREYLETYGKAMVHITELRKRSGGLVKNEIELCLNGIYGVLLLKLKKKTVSPETTEAVESFSQMMNYLADRYRDNKGSVEFPPSMNN